MNSRITVFVPIALTMLLITSLQAKEPAPLAHNPFARPPSAIIVEPRPAVAADGSIQAIDLRATMVVANNGLANVGGRILRPGDDAGGYTLLQVFEDRAIFSHEGKRLTVYVRPELVEDYD